MVSGLFIGLLLRGRGLLFRLLLLDEELRAFARVGALKRRVDRVEFAQRGEAEVLEEQRRRTIEERMPRQFAAADQAHQLKIHQRLHDRVHGHAADLFDLGLRDRLAVGDNGERLQRGPGKSARAIQLQERTHIASACRSRLQTIGSSGADKAESTSAALQLLLQTTQRLVDFPRRAALVDGHHLGVVPLLRRDATHARAQLRRRQRRFAREKERPDDLLQ